MSALNDLDGMVLRQEVYPPMPTKNAELTFTEWDDRVIDIYRVIQDVVNGDNVDAYNPAKTYDGTSSDVYLKFVGYNSRIWQAVFAGTFSGETPAEGIYWTQVTLAQMLPNVLKLAEIGSGASQSVKTVKITIPTAQVLTLYTTPVAFGLTVPVGYFVQPLGLKCGVDFNTVAYATNTSLSVRAVGADVAIGASTAPLAATLSKVSNLNINIAPTAGQTQFIDGVDLEVFVGVGNPTAGDSNIDVYMTYTLVEL
jgi:hypothetical protein